MIDFNLAGKRVSIVGHGTEVEPFIVHGINNDPPLVAVAEEAMLDHWMGKGNWLLIESRLERPGADKTLAILSIRTFDEKNEVIQGQIWFDVSEAFGSTKDPERRS
jgi:hypothetical protein